MLMAVSMEDALYVHWVLRHRWYTSAMKEVNIITQETALRLEEVIPRFLLDR